MLEEYRLSTQFKLTNFFLVLKKGVVSREGDGKRILLKKGTTNSFKSSLWSCFIHPPKQDEELIHFRKSITFHLAFAHPFIKVENARFAEASPPQKQRKDY